MSDFWDDKELGPAPQQAAPVGTTPHVEVNFTPPTDNPTGFWDDTETAPVGQSLEEIKATHAMNRAQSDNQSLEDIVTGVAPVSNLIPTAQQYGQLGQGLVQGAGQAWEGVKHIGSQVAEFGNQGNALPIVNTLMDMLDPGNLANVATQEFANLATGNPQQIGEVVGRNAAPILAGEGAGLLMKGARAAAPMIAEKTIASLVKPLKSDLKFGADPVKALLEDVAPANSLESYLENTKTAKQNIIQQTEAALQAPAAASKKIPLAKVLKIVDAEAEKAAKANNQALYNKIQEWKQSLTHETEADIRGKLRPVSEKSQSLSPLEAHRLKQSIGDSVPSWTEDAVEKGLSEAKVAAYRELRNLIEQQVPGTKALLTKTQGLISAEKAIDRTITRDAGKDILGPGKIITGAAGEALGHALGAPIGTGGLAGITAREILGSTAVKTRVAKLLNKLGPVNKEAYLVEHPDIKEALTGQIIEAPKQLKAAEGPTVQPTTGETYYGPSKTSFEQIESLPEVERQKFHPLPTPKPSGASQMIKLDQSAPEIDAAGKWMVDPEGNLHQLDVANETHRNWIDKNYVKPEMNEYQKKNAFNKSLDEGYVRVLQTGKDLLIEASRDNPNLIRDLKRLEKRTAGDAPIKLDTFQKGSLKQYSFDSGAEFRDWLNKGAPEKRPGIMFDKAEESTLAQAREATKHIKNPVQDVADKYSKRAKMEPSKLGEKVDVDEAFAKRLAEHYEDAKHNPNDPAVKKSYDALNKETLGQYLQIKNSGYKLEPWTGKGEPYGSSAEMLKDVHDKRHLYYKPSDANFGTGTEGAQQLMMGDSGVKINGQPVPYNDLFRAVHDFFGHAKDGLQFGPKGEFNAWRSHSKMYSPEAQGALASETLAQNSVVNFGRHLRKGENIPKKGEAGYVPISERPFAEQKNIVIPEEFIKEAGAAGKRKAISTELNDSVNTLVEAQRLVEQLQEEFKNGLPTKTKGSYGNIRRYEGRNIRDIDILNKVGHSQGAIENALRSGKGRIYDEIVSAAEDHVRNSPKGDSYEGPGALKAGTVDDSFDFKLDKDFAGGITPLPKSTQPEGLIGYKPRLNKLVLTQEAADDLIRRAGGQGRGTKGALLNMKDPNVVSLVEELKKSDPGVWGPVSTKNDLTVQTAANLKDFKETARHEALHAALGKVDNQGLLNLDLRLSKSGQNAMDRALGTKQHYKAAKRQEEVFADLASGNAGRLGLNKTEGLQLLGEMFDNFEKTYGEKKTAEILKRWAPTMYADEPVYGSRIAKGYKNGKPVYEGGQLLSGKSTIPAGVKLPKGGTIKHIGKQSFGSTELELYNVDIAGGPKDITISVPKGETIQSAVDRMVNTWGFKLDQDTEPTWYGTAKKRMEEIGKEYGVPTDTVAAVAAALSPNNRWAQNVVDVKKWVSAFKAGTLTENSSAGTFGHNRKKAFRILNGEKPEDVLSGPKVTAFYKNLMGAENEPVVDFHMANILRGHGKQTTKETAGISPKEYKQLAQKLRDQAKEAGMSPADYQAMKWIEHRAGGQESLFPEGGKK